MKKLSGPANWKVGGLLAVMALVATAFTYSTMSLTAEEPAVRESQSHAKQLSAAFRYAAQEALPSVVSIQKVARPVREAANDGLRGENGREAPSGPNENPFEGTPFEDFFGDRDLRRFFEEMPNRPRQPEQGMGSGVVIDSSGVILTNNHVVAGDGQVRVRLSDGREFEAVRVKTDEKTDLAVIWIEGAGDLKAARMGNSDAMDIGDWVLAVGHPFGLFESVTAGIISAKGRGIGVADREEFLQTDAAINPGNSGGPLVNLEGEVIGINTAISSRTGGYQGAGFAIPINLAKWVSRQLIADGAVRRAYLGIGIEPVTNDISRFFDVAVKSGVIVNQVFDGSPADEAGLKVGDVIVQFGDKKVTGPRELQAAVEKSKIGSRQPVAIIRDGTRMQLEVTARLQPDEFGQSTLRGRRPSRPEDSDRTSFDELGLEVTPLSDELATQLKIDPPDGVLITGVLRNSPAHLAKLSPGMVITEANRKQVRSVEDLQAVLEDQPSDKNVLLLIRTGSGSRYVVIDTDG